ncbi:long-chain-fatty-acid-CoA ligase [Psychrobacter sp. JCM 18901]|nr:long-chain-fatty-acid-CoA ligase [Psychrobacter sp. JCM 18901]
MNQLASSMIEMGLEIGDRIGIWSHNNAEWLLMQLATAKVGVILVNINPAYRTFELQYALNKLGCSALVLMRHFKSSDYAQLIRELCPEIYHKDYTQLDLVEIPTIERIIWIDEPDSDEEFNFMQRFSAWMAEAMPMIHASPSVKRSLKTPTRLMCNLPVVRLARQKVRP